MKDDVRLHHLMCYVNGSKTKKMIGWVGDDLSKWTVDTYADADFAGCEDSLRSTSGAHMVLQVNTPDSPFQEPVSVKVV